MFGELWQSILSIEVVTVFAVFLGPVAAVLMTRYVDHRRERHNRQMEIFRKLMRARRMRLSADYVEALNIIEIEFYKDKNVMSHFRPYIEHFSNDDMNNKRWQEIYDDLFTKLVHSVGKAVGYDIQQLDIFRGGYMPKEWEMTDQEHRIFRKLMIELLNGERSIPITNMYQFGNDKTFPPPPADK